MSFIHNRTGIALCAAAVAVVLLGAGCRESEAPARVGAQLGVDAGDALPTRWTEYRSDTLGITIPYPEGWWVEEKEGGTYFHATPPPTTETEQPAEMWFEHERGNIANALNGLDVVSNEQVERSGINMRRVVFREDFYTPPEVVLYVWERDGQTLEIGGPNATVVERTIASLREQ